MERFAIKIDKKLKANLYKICRLCGIDNPEMVPILTSDDQTEIVPEAMDVDAEPEMPQKIKLLIGLVITKDDKMPQTMCSLCVDKINDFYEFREMCYATNVQTRKLLGLKNIKKPLPDIKPKVEIKEESVLPKVTTKGMKALTGPKGLKSLVPISTTAKLVAKENRKRKQDESEEILGRESRKRRQEELLPLLQNLPKKEPVLPAVSNKKLRLATTPLKDAAAKKAKQKNKDETKDVEIKEEIKEEPKEEKTLPLPLPQVPSPIVYAAAQANKLKQACTICSERFATKTKLEAHTRIQHVPKIERYVCTACNETISKSFDIKNHQLWHKLSKTPYVCSLCGESIVSTYAYARHVREHSIETPPAFLVLDRECPQCHVSYATNFLYNTHPCAVKAKRCAGCNRLQRSDAEYVKHSALCAKVYLNYSKHIMPAVEAQEDAVRIKNENDVEAAAEEMARITGMPLDMAPVVQLTRLSSPLIMAASHCVAIPGLEDSPSTSGKKSGKKGVSKKELKRVDDLLKSTLDALVSIKHEPEVHVETEPPSAEGEQSDNDDPASDENCNMDVGFQDEDDSDDGITGTNLSDVTIKQEIDEHFETPKLEESKLVSGGGLKLKIRKEHGQLNSSIIEQQKSDEKRAEKRKKKKKHKDKIKDKSKTQKELTEEQNSLDSFNYQHNDDNISSAESPGSVRIKAEPVENATNDANGSQGRPQPEAMIMTSIPMMQLQIACISEGVDFNCSNATNVTDKQQVSQAPPVEASDILVPTPSKGTEPDDVKPTREELDRLLQISHVSGGIEKASDEMENESEMQRCNNDDDHQEHEREEENENDQGHNKDKEDASTETPLTGKKLLSGGEVEQRHQNITRISHQTLGSNTATTKRRNKACKSTAKPSISRLTAPVLQISSVRSGVSLQPSSDSVQCIFTPVFIKPEPQNRGYSDEHPMNTPSHPPLSNMSQNSSCEFSTNSDALPTADDNDEQNYISSIDFNNITIKQEKDLDINDVQITANTTRYSNLSINGIKKRKVVRRVRRKSGPKGNDDHHREDSNKDKNVYNKVDQDYIGEDLDEVDEDTCQESDQDEYDEDPEEEEDEDEGEEEEEEDDEEEEDEEEEEEEREYRELEYPPELISKGHKKDDGNENGNKEQMIPNNIDEENVETICSEDNPKGAVSRSNENLTTADKQGDTLINESSSILPPVFVISNVCSNVIASGETTSNTDTSNDNVLQNLESFPTESDIIVTNHNLSAEAKGSVINKQQGTQLPELVQDVTNTHQDLEKPLVHEIPVLQITSVTSGSATPYAQNSPIQILLGNRQQSVEKNNDIAIFSQFEEANNRKDDSNLALNTDEPNVSVRSTLNAESETGPQKLSDVIGPASEQQEFTNIPVHSEYVANCEIQMELRRSVQISAGKTLTDSNEINSQSETCNVLAVESDAERYNPLHQSGIALESNSAAKTMSSEIQQQLISPACMDTTEEISQLEHAADVSVSGNDQCSVAYRQYSKEADDGTPHDSHEIVPNIVNTTPNQFATQFALAKSCSQINLSHTSDNIQGTSSSSQCTRSETIEGFVVEPNEMKLNAYPLTKLDDSCIDRDDDIEDELDEEEDFEDEDNFAEEEEPDANGDKAEKQKLEMETLDDSNINLEQHQNEQNQQQQLQEHQSELVRPTAIALHPYLEDISSSSNSFLSNTLSQTPPPTQSTSNIIIAQAAPSQSSEETENILNESSDVLNRRPSFSFDNINEIAENNNNANLEREQLQDDQQQRNNVS